MKPDTKARNPRLLKVELNANKKRKKRTVGETKLSKKDVENIVELKKSKSLRQLAKMFDVSITTIFTAIKRATKEPTKVSEVAIRKNSTSLYHMEGGMQVAN
jgi:DNA-binding CsgD family transcriptional regulator